MNSYKKLFDNIFIFSLGTLGSKIITFLLVPLYTHYLTQAEYGTTDLVLVTVQMLLPLVSLTMNEAIIRFTMKDEYNNGEIFTNSIFISLGGYLIFVLAFPVLSYFNLFEAKLIYLYTLLLAQIINQSLSQYARGIGRVKVFAINGVLTTLFTAVLNIIFLVIFNFGVDGYFLALIISYILSSLYLIVKINPLKDFSIKSIDQHISKKLLIYSIPLIPNSLIWWVINGSNRYFINYFVNIEANGLFAVSSKIPALINIVTSVFSQAWQLSVFEEYDENRKDSFHTNIFDLYMSILFVSVSFIILILKPMFNLLFSDAYFEAWKPVPFLLVGTIFSALSGFLGVAYTASGKTTGVLTTSIYGGIASFISSITLIPIFGITGAGLSSTISFFIMFLIRYFDTKKLLSIIIPWKKLIYNIIFIAMQIMFAFLLNNSYFELILQVIILLLIFINNRVLFNYIKNGINMIKKRL